jgi:type I restriction enzyme S subunit
LHQQLEETKRGAVLSGLNTSTIGNLLVVLPPMEQQLEILDRLAQKLLPIQAAIQRTENEISLAQEYRRRLTLELVIGLRDVRTLSLILQDTTELGGMSDPAAEDLVEAEEAELLYSGSDDEE